MNKCMPLDLLRYDKSRYDEADALLKKSYEIQVNRTSQTKTRQ